MKLPRAATAGITLAGILVTGPASMSAGQAIPGTPMATVSKPTWISAYKGRLLWSAYDPGSGLYRLVLWQGGRAQQLP